MKFLILAHSSLIIHEIDKSLDTSQRHHKRQDKLDNLYVFVKKLKIKIEQLIKITIKDK